MRKREKERERKRKKEKERKNSKSKHAVKDEKGRILILTRKPHNSNWIKSYFFLPSLTNWINREREREREKRKRERKKEFQETGFLLTESKGVRGKLSWSESHLILFSSFLFLLLFLSPSLFLQREKGRKKEKERKWKKEKERNFLPQLLTMIIMGITDINCDRFLTLFDPHLILSFDSSIILSIHFFSLYLYTILTITNSMIVFLNHSFLFLSLDIWLQWENGMQKRYLNPLKIHGKNAKNILSFSLYLISLSLTLFLTHSLSHSLLSLSHSPSSVSIQVNQPLDQSLMTMFDFIW